MSVLGKNSLKSGVAAVAFSALSAFTQVASADDLNNNAADMDNNTPKYTLVYGNDINPRRIDALSRLIKRKVTDNFIIKQGDNVSECVRVFNNKGEELASFSYKRPAKISIYIAGLERGEEYDTEACDKAPAIDAPHTKTTYK